MTWTALGVGLLLTPVPSPASVRARHLTAGGRLQSAPTRPASLRAASARVIAAAVGAAMVFLGVVVAVLWGPVLSAAALIAAATAGHLLQAARHRRTRHRRQAALGAAVALLAAELRAGAAPGAALSAAADVAPDHAHAFHEAAANCRAGTDPDFRDVLNGDLSGLGHAWRLAATAGTPIADVCSRVAADLADRIDQHRAVTVALAGTRSSAALLAGLPVVGIALAGAMQARPLHVLFGTSAGRLLCLAGIGLDAAGLLWTQWLTARADGP